MICLSDNQTVASEYAKQLMNQTHISISRLTLLWLSFLDISLNHGIVLQKMRVRTMTFDISAKRGARKFVMAATVYDWRFLQSNLFNLRLCLHYNGQLFLAPRKAVRYSVNTPIRYVTLHCRDRRGVASFRHRNLAATTVFMYEQKLNPRWFSWRRKSYPI